MKISATISNSLNQNNITVVTNDEPKSIPIASKATGYGSSVNGGELLLSALAVCYCNDIYREASKKNIEITSVEVEVTANFGKEGEAGFNFQYKPKVVSTAPPDRIRQLIEHVDSVAEIHKTLRNGTEIALIR
jgi:uncharacterized OsmC-like protein